MQEHCYQVFKVPEHWSAFELFGCKEQVGLEDIAQRLRINSTDLIQNAIKVREKGLDPWKELGLIEEGNRWIVDLPQFFPYYAEFIFPYQRLDHAMTVDELPFLDGRFLMDQVLNFLPETLRPIYQTSLWHEPQGLVFDQEMKGWVIDMANFRDWFFAKPPPMAAQDLVLFERPNIFYAPLDVIHAFYLGLLRLAEMGRELHLETEKVIELAQQREKDGFRLWQDMGLVKIEDEWAFYPPYFIDFYRNALCPYRHCPADLSVEELLDLEGHFLLSSFWLAAPHYYEVTRVAQSEKCSGITMDVPLRTGVIDMKQFKMYLKRNQLIIN